MPKRSAQEKLEYYNHKLRRLAEKENRRRLRALETPSYEDNRKYPLFSIILSALNIHF